MRSVYLLKEDANDYYKIGISKDTKKRIQQLQTGSTGHITLYDEFVSEYATKIEKALHRRYSIQNVSGEWFNLTHAQVKSFIKDCEKLEKNFLSIDEKKNPYFNEYQKRISR